MARIRSIKPELRTSLTVAEWPREVRYFWVLLWGYLDDHGRGVDDARLIKADCFPLDDDLDRQTIEEWLEVLVAARPLCRYQVKGRRYMHAVNWTEHQKPSHAAESRIPPCAKDHSGDTPEPLAKPSGDTPEIVVPEQVVRAGSREQAAARATSPEKVSVLTPEGKARRIVREATDATEDEAAAIVAKVRGRQPPPKSLHGLLRRMADDGDFPAMLGELRASVRRAEVAVALKDARAGPKCVHGTPGGANPHPDSGEPLCASCRFAARQPEARPA